MKEAFIEKIKARKCVIDCHAHVGVDFRSYLDFGYPYCMSFEDMAVRMKYLGIDRAVLMPLGQSCYYRFKPENPGKVEASDE